MLVYYLQHRHISGTYGYENLYDTKALGYFKSKKELKKAISYYKTLPGFADYKNSFEIITYHFKCKRSSLKCVYVVDCEQENVDDSYDLVTNIGVFLKETDAQKALQEFRKKNIDIDGTFTIDCWKFGHLEWVDGFNSWWE